MSDLVRSRDEGGAGIEHRLPPVAVRVISKRRSRLEHAREATARGLGVSHVNLPSDLAISRSELGDLTKEAVILAKRKEVKPSGLPLQSLACVAIALDRGDSAGDFGTDEVAVPAVAKPGDPDGRMNSYALDTHGWCHLRTRRTTPASQS